MSTLICFIVFSTSNEGLSVKDCIPKYQVVQMKTRFVTLFFILYLDYVEQLFVPSDKIILLHMFTPPHPPAMSSKGKSQYFILSVHLDI